MKEKIMEIINDWDPIDLIPPAPLDEYSDEVEDIYEYISRNACVSCEELAQKISMVFERTFTADLFKKDISECKEVAQRILKLQT